MSLESIWLLYLILLLIPLLYLLWNLSNRRRRRFQSYADQKFFLQYYSAQSPFYSNLKLVLRFSSMALIIVALAGPQWDYQETDTQTTGLDIICCIDVSRSMDATDIAPSRLAMAKLQLSGFVDELQGDRIGIIAFAGTASLECPLTDDYESVQMVINGLSTELAFQVGTDIGAALELASKSFNSGQGDKILVLISDGEDLEISALANARKLKNDGITIYSLGVGTESGTKITNPETGEERLSVLDTASLSRIAVTGGGKYYSVSPGQNEISILLREIYGKERGLQDGRSIYSMKKQYGLFVFAALAILLLEMLINPYRNRKNKVPNRA